MSKLLIIAAGGVGYLLGSRAGHEPYEKFSQKAQQVRDDPRVQKRASQFKRRAEEQVDEKVGDEPAPARPTVAGQQGSLP